MTIVNMIEREEILEVKKICFELFNLKLELEKISDKDLSVIESASDKLMQLLKEKHERKEVR